jgi:hypothetical protein
MDAWLYFPGIKVGEIDLSSSFWKIWFGLIVNRGNSTEYDFQNFAVD